MPDGSSPVSISINEVVQLGAVDTELFSRVFFTRAFRQASPSFAGPVWNALEAPGYRQVNLQLFRGSSKTTRLRAFAAKRIAYGISRTILVVGKSERHALQTIKWIKKQIEFNKLYVETFGLRKGSKWADNEIEILHGVEGHSIWIAGMGVTGSLRGLNFEDYRPDLIILDDICNEENSSTLEQRNKIEELIYGALLESLAPASEAPDARLVALQTPLNKDDFSTKALADPSWFSMKIGCFTRETESLPVDSQESIWPERWSSLVLRQEKRNAILRNRLSLWLREKECKITSPETSSFKPEWLVRWSVVPEGMPHILVFDPVPPPSQKQIDQGFADKDYEAIACLGVYKGRFYLREISVNRGHDPGWTVAEAFRLSTKYRPMMKWVVEVIAYQRVLAWILREGMKRFRRYFPIEEYESHESKYLRILNGISGPAAEGVLLLPPDASPEGIMHSEGMQMFLQQYIEYPNVTHDDALEVVAVALTSLAGKGYDGGVEDFLQIENEIEGYRPLNLSKGCP